MLPIKRPAIVSLLFIETIDLLRWAVTRILRQLLRQTETLQGPVSVYLAHGFRAVFNQHIVPTLRNEFWKTASKGLE